MSYPSLENLDPSDEPLLSIVFQHVDDAMLKEIAEADYGLGVDEHLQALKEIKAGAIPAPMQWEPKEVLELIRWSEPDDPKWSPGSTGERGHWMRLFACTVLLRAAAEPENDGYFDGDDSTIIQLVDSALKLGEKTSNAALRFLCWRMRCRDLLECDRPYYAIAILLVAVLLAKWTQPMEQELVETAVNDEIPISRLYKHCMKRQTWKSITRDVLSMHREENSHTLDLMKGLLGEGWMS